MIPGAAENDPVAAREHVAAAQVTVIDLRLRQEYLELTTHRDQLLVIKERTRTEPGAIEDDRFTQSRELFTTAKLLHDYATAGDVKIAQERAEIDRRLDQHRGVLPYKRKPEIIFRIAMCLNLRIKIVAAGQLAPERRFLTHQLKCLDPAHAVLRTHEQLKRTIRNVARLVKLFVEFTGGSFVNRRWRPRSAGDVRRRIRRQRFCIDRYRPWPILVTALQQPRG